MYKIIATEDFVNTLCDLPLKHLPFVINSFASIEKIDASEEYMATSHNGMSIIEMLEKIRKQS